MEISDREIEMNKTIKQDLIIHYEIKYDPSNDWYALYDETKEIDRSVEITTSREIAYALLNTIIRHTEKLALGNMENIPCEEIESFEETVTNEVKDNLGLDQEGDLDDNYSSLVRSVSISTSLTPRIEENLN